MILTSPQARDWDKRGRPESIARPVAELATVLRHHGYAVGIVGDERHLNAEPPEDHTPYSATGWPVASAYAWVHALDVMPPPAGSHLPSLALLGSRLIADRQAQLPEARWIKYLNWEPEGSAGPCWHESWQPSYTRISSTDRGHLHISARSDCDQYAGATSYDPVAAIQNAASAGASWTAVTIGNLPILRPGSTGTAVRRAQILVNHFRSTPIAVDGVYGPQTVGAVTAFQRAHALTHDGIVGPETWASLLGVHL